MAGKKNEQPDVSETTISPSELAELLIKSSNDITLSFDGSTWTLQGINKNDYRELRALLRSKTTNKE
jgi:hypothetical protein